MPAREKTSEMAERMARVPMAFWPDRMLVDRLAEL